MHGLLKTIVNRIIEEEGALFRDFDAALFPLEKRHSPIDVLTRGEKDFLVIAEVKKGSPSRGLIRKDFCPASVAQAYEEGGASAISVVTEKNFFFGDKDCLRQIKKAVRLPVLRKDFIVHEYQIYESYNLGADFVLLISACLSRDELRHLHRAAESLGMRALVEIHDEKELEKALEAGSRLVGINNRDLETLDVDWTRSLRLRPRVPDGIQVISESGLSSHHQIKALQDAGFSGVLVGEHLMRQDDHRQAVRDLIHGQG